MPTFGAELAANPSFETSTTGWTATNGTLVRVTTPTQSGTGAGQLTATALGIVRLRHADIQTGLTPGALVLISGWVRSAATSRFWNIKIDWYGTAGYVSTSNVTSGVNSVVGSWAQITNSAGVTMPSTANRGSIYFEAQNVPASEAHFFDSLSVKGEVVSEPEPSTDADCTVRVSGVDVPGRFIFWLGGVTYGVPAGGTATVPPAPTTTLTPLGSGVRVGLVSNGDGGSALLSKTVQRRPVGGSWTTIATTSGSATQHDDLNVTGGQEYGYRHLVSSSAGPSTYSPEVTILTEVSPVVQTDVEKSGAVVTTVTPALSTAATAGRVLVSLLVADKSTGAITTPTGYTALATYNGTSTSGQVAYKTAAGGETSAAWSWATARSATGILAELALGSVNLAGATTTVAPTPVDDTSRSALTVDMGAAPSAGWVLAATGIDTQQNATSAPWSEGVDSVAWVSGDGLANSEGAALGLRKVLAGQPRKVTTAWGTTDQQWLSVTFIPIT